MLYPLVEQKMQLLKSKRYFSISEVSEFCQETNSVLRYWEQEFSQLSPKKVQNQRRYQQKDIQTILTIQTLLRTEGLSIEQSKKHLLASKLQPTQKPNTPNTHPNQINVQNLKNIQDSLREILSYL